MNAGRFQECYTQLETATILPAEGQSDVHSLFVQCQLALALEEMKKGDWARALQWIAGSREYPERLGTGKPHNPDYRLQDVLEMLCQEGAGNPVKAGEAWARVETGRKTRATRASVAQWKEARLAAQPALEALRELSDLVRGQQRRRRH